MQKQKVGAKPKPVEARMVTVTFRATPAQKAKFRSLGGGKWVRFVIDVTPAK